MKKFALLSVLTGLLLSAAPAKASFVYGLTTSGDIIRFESSAPGIVTTLGPTGLGVNGLVGIDFRPATGELYGVGANSNLYTINQATGAATVGAALNPALSGTSFGVDFNPVPDRMRIISDADQNLRVNVATGVGLVDGTLAFAPGDMNVGVNPNVVAAGYTNSFAGTMTTTLYGLESNLNALVSQNPPNAGTLNSIGPVGFDFTPVAGFDIDPRMNVAFAALNSALGGQTQFFQINLTTGAGTLVGSINTGSQVSGIAVAPIPEPGTLTLLGAGLAGLALLRRRRKSA